MAEKAARSYARESSVLLFEPPFGAPTGSGTLVRTRDGCAVLTCKHVLDGDWSHLVVEHRSGVELQRAIASVEKHDSCDIAVARLRDPRVLESFAITPARIAKKEMFPLSMRRPMLVVGFPIQEMISSSGDASDVVRGIREFSYLTTLAGSSRDFFSLDWDLAEPDADDDWDWEKKGAPAGHAYALKKPKGLSGGAVWTFEAMYDRNCADTRISTLVGIPFKHTNQRQLAVPASLWRPWLIDVIVA